MGIQDRDWYRDEQRAKRQAKQGKRVPVDLLDNANPPKLWGADWHWTIKCVVYGALVVALVAIIKAVS